MQVKIWFNISHIKPNLCPFLINKLISLRFLQKLIMRMQMFWMYNLRHIELNVKIEWLCLTLNHNMMISASQIWVISCFCTSCYSCLIRSHEEEEESQHLCAKLELKALLTNQIHFLIYFSSLFCLSSDASAGKFMYTVCLCSPWWPACR